MELSRKDAKNAKEPINLCDFAALRDISLCNILLTSTVLPVFRPNPAHFTLLNYRRFRFEGLWG
jgi:hypothetical protein